MQQQLAELNFLDVRFQIEVRKTEQYGADGYDEVEFMISTNPGEPLKPLGRIASGGELSRVMLAIKTVLADQDAIDTVIFDEIDTGISGRTAQKVSEKLALIGKSRPIWRSWPPWRTAITVLKNSRQAEARRPASAGLQKKRRWTNWRVSWAGQASQSP